MFFKNTHKTALCLFYLFLAIFKLYADDLIYHAGHTANVFSSCLL